jgi:uncharacterized protein
VSARRTASLLWVLLGLFFCRVVGQLVVVLYAPSFLPPMHEWYSGLMPYRYLFPAQILIIVLFTNIALGMTRGTGFWTHQKPRLGLWLRNFGVIYFASMVARYVLRMSWYPEERWFGGTIPILFHWVLATYILVLGSYHLHGSNEVET